MPPRKKYVLSTTMRWSAFEVELFRYMSQVTHRTTADDVRAAVRLYARQLAEFDPDEFAESVRRNCLGQIPVGPERERLRLEVDAFVSAFTDRVGNRLDRIRTARAPMRIKSNSASFELEEDGLR